VGQVVHGRTDIGPSFGAAYRNPPIPYARRGIASCTVVRVHGVLYFISSSSDDKQSANSARTRQRGSLVPRSDEFCAFVQVIMVATVEVPPSLWV
jgi:hypothetical protein